MSGIPIRALRERQPHPDTASGDAILIYPEERDALVEAVEAAHLYFSGANDTTLDAQDALARFDFGEQ